jgi:hypothetical protein
MIRRMSGKVMVKGVNPWRCFATLQVGRLSRPNPSANLVSVKREVTIIVQSANVSHEKSSSSYGFFAAQKWVNPWDSEKPIN